MENLKDRDIFTLSSGERQKIAFLAATTLNPQIYVLDEPSANLDIHEGIIKDDLQMTGKSTFKIVKDFMMKGGE